MHKYLFIFSVLIVGICFSCGDQSLDEISTPMGEEYIDGEAGIMMIDTFSVKLSTVIRDSVRTSQSGEALVGSFNHPDFGQIHSDAVFRISSPGRINIDEDDVYDGIEFCIKYNDYFLGDTTVTHSFTIEEIESDLKDMEKDQKKDDYFYNTTRVTTKRILGEYTAVPKVTNSDTIKIPLDDDFGRELFEMLQNNDDNITVASDFYDYFKGVMLKSNRDINQSVIGYNVGDSCCIKLLYHTTLDQRIDKEVEMKVEANSIYQFNSIEVDRNGALLNGLIDQEVSISSEDTNDKCFVQAGTGIYAKIDFPGLERAEQLPALNQIIKAEIVFLPLDYTEDDFNDFPNRLFVYESNRKNYLGEVILASNNSDISYMYLYDNAVDEEEDEYYTVDITNQFVAEFLDGIYDDDFSFLIGLSSSDMASKLTTISFGGHNNADFQPKLRLYTYYY
ncbi:DUF4270 family protein [Plebeiibacterium sediminum]|uniref:DUF4270 domain-containing protein n=1 Tax=Plebeiibacterium sediminum TaxID=2992112 RepID=A0AAE3M0T5_9BACT|nr:DUF4270 family protein [Plebeiobacterium sediminum]MCW3785032.1 DUF4270 domain-containing protein [Plebeiobacterium sediminum]